MSDERSAPPPQVVKSYATSVAARTAQRQEERRTSPVFPNIAQAAVSHRPGEGPQTLAQHAEAQHADAPAPDRGLRPETIEGLKALHQAQAAAQTPEPARAVEPAKDELEDEDDFVDPLRGAKQDVINNVAERKAVAKRVSEIDLAEGLLTGEFTQLVPIVPGKLEVRYRSLTSGENNELRLTLIEELQKDGRRGHLAEDLLGFYQIVASVVSINKTDYVKHMVSDGPMQRMKFQRELFLEKVNAFMAFPMPLISALGTHGMWFDQRVRELFTTSERIKNG